MQMNSWLALSRNKKIIRKPFGRYSQEIVMLWEINKKRLQIFVEIFCTDLYLFIYYICPHVIGFVAEYFFLSLESGFKISRFVAEFVGCVLAEAVFGMKKLRIRVDGAL